jgi:amino acid transporter
MTLGRDKMMVGASLLLSIGFVSSNAATQIISFATNGVYVSFQMVAIASLLASLRGWRADGEFKLGSAGLVVKVIALVFGIASIINLMWPRTPAFKEIPSGCRYSTVRQCCGSSP